MSFCRNCPQCVFVSESGRHVKPPLHPIPVNRPFQVLGVDIMDLPITGRETNMLWCFRTTLVSGP